MICESHVVGSDESFYFSVLNMGRAISMNHRIYYSFQGVNLFLSPTKVLKCDQALLQTGLTLEVLMTWQSVEVGTLWLNQV